MSTDGTLQPRPPQPSPVIAPGHTAGSVTDEIASVVLRRPPLWLYPAFGISFALMLLFLCGHEPWRTFEEDYRSGRKAAYNQQKQRWTDALVRRAEEMLLPGLSDLIAVREAATPLTNWRYTGNTEGAIYGFEPSMDNAYMNRIENRTPLKGLYLASAWGNPGGGYGGVLAAGQMAYQDIVSDWGG